MAVWDGLIPSKDLARVQRFVDGMRQQRRPGQRPALLVIDMNLRFTTSEYTPGDDETGTEVVRHLQPLLQQARVSSIPVIYTTTSLRHTPAQQGQWGPSTPANGADDPRASQIHPGLTPGEGEEVIWKIPPSGFLNTDLVSLLNHYQVDTVIVTGVATSGCVRATAVDAFSYNYNVIVPEECCGDRCQVSHQVNLFDLHSKYATVQPMAETMAYLRSVPPNPRKVGGLGADTR